MNATINQIFRPILEALPENNRLERIWVLAKVDFKKRYYNSKLGLAWAFLNPLFRFLIYYVVFTVIFQNGIKYFSFYLFLGLLCWFFFAEGTKKSFNILQSKRYLLENIQFDKQDLFYASAFSVVMGFAFNLSVYAVATLFSPISITVQMLWLPFYVFNLFLVTLGISMILSACAIFLKDMRQIWDMVILAAFWTTPIFYGRDVLYEKLPFLLYLNPVAGIVINIRESMIYGNPPDYFMLVYNLLFGVVLVLVGKWAVQQYTYKAIEKL